MCVLQPHQPVNAKANLAAFLQQQQLNQQQKQQKHLILTTMNNNNLLKNNNNNQETPKRRSNTIVLDKEQAVSILNQLDNSSHRYARLSRSPLSVIKHVLFHKCFFFSERILFQIF